MTGDQRDIVAGHLVGDRDRLFRVAGVVADLKVELLAEHAAGGVDVGHGHLAAILHLGAEGGVLTGDRADHGDRGRVVATTSAATRNDRRCSQSDDQPGDSFQLHFTLQHLCGVDCLASGAQRVRQVSGLVRS